MSTIKSSDEHLTLNADGSSKDIKLQANASEKVIIKSDGKVGIGTSSPTSVFEISGTGAQYAKVANGSNKAYMGVAGDNKAYFGSFSATDVVLAHGTSNKWTLNSSGNLFPAATSQGIVLGNTSDVAANRLDDYEEGTWSPVFKGSTGSAGSWASSTFTSTYTKIGRTVHIACAGYLTNLGSWTGNAIITGLPFASSFGEHSPLAISGFPNTTTYGTGAGSQPLITCYVGAASSQISFKAGAGQDPACPYSIVRTGYYVQLSGTYTAT
jgi:hypothetical protein